MTLKGGCKSARVDGTVRSLVEKHSCPDLEALAEDVRRKQEREERIKRKEQKRREKSGPPAVIEVSAFTPSLPPAEPSSKAPAGPIAFVFPGQGSQAVGMLKVNCLM